MTAELDEKVSVIIPAYNAAEYIERAVTSVLEQTHGKLELIVVDDGSTDDTAGRVSRLAEKDARLRLVRTENSGPAAARNRGIDEVCADADYIMFLDADDHLAPDAVEYALSGAHKGAALVLMGFTIENPDGSTRDYFEPEAVYDKDSLGAALPKLYMANMLNQVWAKLFSAPLLRESKLRFPDYRWGEDRLFLFEFLERAGGAAMQPECKYFYVMHPGESLITRFIADKPEACCRADERMQRLCARFGTEDDSPCRYMFVKSIFSCMTNMFTPGCKLDYRGKRKYVRNILRNEQVQRRSHGVYGGAAVRIMCAVLHTRSVTLNMLMFRTVALIGRISPDLFMKIKHKK